MISPFFIYTPLMGIKLRRIYAAFILILQVTEKTFYIMDTQGNQYQFAHLHMPKYTKKMKLK